MQTQRFTRLLWEKRVISDQLSNQQCIYKLCLQTKTLRQKVISFFPREQANEWRKLLIQIMRMINSITHSYYMFL